MADDASHETASATHCCSDERHSFTFVEDPLGGGGVPGHIMAQTRASLTDKGKRRSERKEDAKVRQDV